MNNPFVGHACAKQASAWVLVLVIALSGGCGKSEEQSRKRPTPQVSILTIVPQIVPFTPSYVAQTVSSQQVNIVARVSGFLDKIAYREGELVREGQLLFQLDPKPFEVKLQAAEGELQAQQARFVTARANLDRTKPLAELNALSNLALVDLIMGLEGRDLLHRLLVNRMLKHSGYDNDNGFIHFIAYYFACIDLVNQWFPSRSFL